MNRGPRTWRRHRVRALILTTAATALVSLAAATSVSAVPRSFYGVVPQIPPGISVQDIDRMGQGKVGTVRVWFNWGALDPSIAPGDTNWSSIDQIMAASARNRIHVLPFLFGTPRWVAEGYEGHQCYPYCGPYAPASEQGLYAWKSFVAEAVARYGRNGSFWAQNPTLPAVPIRAWQVWNEQNSPVYYKPRVDPKAYAKLLAAAEEGIGLVDPAADVVLGGMAKLGGVPKALTSWEFLARLYKRKGVKPNFDGVAAHPYGTRLKPIGEQIRLIRAAMRKARDRRVGLWITEIGWGSDDNGNPLSSNPAGQANRLKQAFAYFRRERRALNVKTVLWYSWADSPSPVCLWCASSGLFSSSLDAKPAWRAFTKFTGGS